MFSLGAWLRYSGAASLRSSTAACIFTAIPHGDHSMYNMESETLSQKRIFNITPVNFYCRPTFYRIVFNYLHYVGVACQFIVNEMLSTLMKNIKL